ncbi:MAG: U32 family peptidase [Elusimicrobia bacterium]|nr:U32 family peptidase [Elusimicrobiota bacterium]
MKILAPVNKAAEVDTLADAGADELYCGMLPPEWKRLYSNVVSPNRREWSSANLGGPEELAAVAERAHRRGLRLLFTLNALYTEAQYPLVREAVAAARAAKADALVVADLGLLLELGRDSGLELHLSTGGTVFNAEAARFYQGLGVKRVTVPRHLQPAETAALIRDCPGLEFEVFALNSGCKNIDGFCTFLHGTSELRYGSLWRAAKRLNFDRFLLGLLKRAGLAGNLGLAGVDSPCLHNYRISVERSADKTAAQAETLERNLAAYFSLLSGADPCAACRAAEFQAMGVHGLKIVGRNYSTGQKAADVRFLKAVLAAPGRARQLYREHYGSDCRRLCYYPE